MHLTDFVFPAVWSVPFGVWQVHALGKDWLLQRGKINILRADLYETGQFIWNGAHLSSLFPVWWGGGKASASKTFEPGTLWPWSSWQALKIYKESPKENRIYFVHFSNRKHKWDWFSKKYQTFSRAIHGLQKCLHFDGQRGKTLHFSVRCRGLPNLGCSKIVVFYETIIKVWHQ